jgi:CRISPR-associated endoribonuclease Cas6
MTSLGAVALVLHAEEPTTIDHHMGRAVQQLALSIVSQQDRAKRRVPPLSDQIHDTHDLKPYAVSGLLQPLPSLPPDRGRIKDEKLKLPAPVHGHVKPGDRAWIRIVGLNSELLADFTQPVVKELDGAAWSLDGFLTDTAAHPWSGRTTYLALAKQAEDAPLPEKIVFEFASPTAFRSRGNTVPLPIPALVFGSLTERWNAFGPFRLSDLLSQFVEQQVVVHRYEAETRILTFKQGSYQVGFVGRVTFEVLPRNRSLENANPTLAPALAAEYENLARAVGLLADFAFYSGIGMKTAQGMGMARRLG